MPSKMLKSHGHSHFKKRRLQGFKLRLVLGYKIHHFLLADVLPINFNSLPKILVMRGSIHPHFVASCLQDGCQNMGGGALAIGASYMHTLKLLFRISQSSTQSLNVIQSFLKSILAHSLKHRQLLIQII